MWKESRQELVRLFGRRWSDQEVEAAIWKLVGDAAAEGRLLVDLAEVELSLSTELSLLDPSLPPILPDPLPSSLEGTVDERQPPRPFESREDRPLALAGHIPGPIFDASTLHDADLSARFPRG